MKGTREPWHKLLQIVDGHILQVDLFSTIDVSGISENANGHSWPGDIWESIDVNQTLHDGRNNLLAHFTVPEKRLSLWGS
jgi:hypothetical protein